MKEAFASDQDIHTYTASLMFDVKEKDVDGPMRDALEYTGHERNMYDRYQKLVGRAAGKDHFVVALRMFNARLPESPAKKLNLNEMKVG